MNEQAGETLSGREGSHAQSAARPAQTKPFCLPPHLLPEKVDPALYPIAMQTKRCLDLLNTLEVANRKILQRIAIGCVGSRRIQQLGYDNSCKIRAAKSDAVTDEDLALVLQDEAFKSVCESRWILGEEVSHLHDWIAKVGPIPAPFAYIEARIRRSVTGTSRTPEELADAIERLHESMTEFTMWKPGAGIYGPTLTQRMRSLLESHWLVAPILVIAAALLAFLTLVKLAAETWQVLF